MAKKNKKIRRLSISSDVQHQLIKEFDVSSAMVSLSLKFHLYSDTAKGIRKRAMELVAEEVTKNKALMAELEDVEKSDLKA